MILLFFISLTQLVDFIFCNRETFTNTFKSLARITLKLSKRDENQSVNKYTHFFVRKRNCSSFALNVYLLFFFLNYIYRKMVQYCFVCMLLLILSHTLFWFHLALTSSQQNHNKTVQNCHRFAGNRPTAVLPLVLLFVLLTLSQRM